jgi:hypothetical protein
MGVEVETTDDARRGGAHKDAVSKFSYPGVPMDAYTKSCAFARRLPCPEGVQKAGATSEQDHRRLHALERCLLLDGRPRVLGSQHPSRRVLDTRGYLQAIRSSAGFTSRAGVHADPFSLAYAVRERMDDKYTDASEFAASPVCILTAGQSTPTGLRTTAAASRLFPRGTGSGPCRDGLRIEDPSYLGPCLQRPAGGPSPETPGTPAPECAG